jgi:MYXO-CTERM domain-containing protein
VKTRTALLIAPLLLGLASPPRAAAAPTPAQIATLAAVNTLLLAPEPAPAASGAAGALALALLAGTRPMRRRKGRLHGRG